MARRNTLKDYNALTSEFKHASDRAVGILGGAYVEEALLDALLFWLGMDSVQDRGAGKAIEELLGNGAPLGTFSNKIMLAEAVKLIGPRTRRDLDLLRKVRNHCAHSINPNQFADAPLSEWVSNLSPRALPIPHSTAYLPDRSQPRQRFEECCHQLYDQFYNDDRASLAQDLGGDPYGFELD